MPTHIALFRGINVGGMHILPMRELVDDLQSLGCKDVRTYIQSGNAVFEYAKGVASLGERISKKIEDRHGFEPHVLILGADQLHRAIASNPFPEAESEPKSLHLSFLSSPPPRLTARQIDALNALKSPTERYKLIGHVYYLHAPDGVGRSKLAAKVEKILDVPTTARNWRTVTKLAEMA